MHTPEHPDDADQFVGEAFGKFRDPGEQDAALKFGVREVDVQEQAAAFERLGEFPGGVRGEHHERNPGGCDGSKLRDGDREIAQDLQQQALDLDIGLVGFVDEQNGGLGSPDRGQQWTRQ